MSPELSAVPPHLWYIVIVFTLLYLVVRRAYPRPLPGIPYNIKAARQLFGDLPELQTRQKKGESIRPWFLEQAQTHNSAITQIFLGPFARPGILISDYREVNDILMNGDADYKRGKKVDVFSGILPHAHPAMETFDPKFKPSRDLLRDLMAPSFLHSVSAPHTYIVACNLLNLWRLKARIANGRPFEVSNDITEFSFDAILSAATGLGPSGGDLNRQISYLGPFEGMDFCKAGSISIDEPITLPAIGRSTKLQALNVDEESIWKGFYMPWPRLYHRINKLRPSVRNAGKTIREYIASRTADAVHSLTSGSNPESALDYVIQREIAAAKKAGREPVLDDPRIRDGIYGYLIAGHDTSMGSLTWIVRRLVGHPDEQIKIRNSLRETYRAAWNEKRLPTAAELIKHDPYLDAFIEEVLRYNCPVVTIALEMRRDSVVLGYPVPKNTPVFLNLTGPSLTTPSIPVRESARSRTSQSHNKKARPNWDDLNPEVFQPERWLREDENGRMVFNSSSGPTLAFSAGNRGCWGKRLGQLELRIVLSLIVWTFQLKEVPEELSSWDTYDSLVTAPKQCFVRLAEVEQSGSMDK